MSNPIKSRPPRAACADINWLDNHLPVSSHYNDVYFSKADGYRESLHVFIDGNDLINRFKALSAKQNFVIAETGFGSGLNFLAAWHMFERHAPSTAKLHFLSVEKSPLTKADLIRSHTPWPHLRAKCWAITEHYPEPVNGIHRWHFKPGASKSRQQDRTRVFLSVFYGEVEAWLEASDFRANAWFLDGFSPSKNPAMWSPAVSKQVAEHSGSGTTLATFTVARIIREQLTSHGFSLQKKPGFRQKREMTTGIMEWAGSSPPALSAHPIPPANSSQTSPIMVVGSGLAGCWTARWLAQRGHRVEVIESQPGIAAGASGNIQGALYIKLAVDWSPHTRYHLASYLFALRAYNALFGSDSALWNPTGVLQLAQGSKELARQEKFLLQNDYPESIVYSVDSKSAEHLSGVSLAYGGLFFPAGGWCRPASLCEALLQHPLIAVHTGTHIISQQPACAGGIRLVAANGAQFNGSHAVYCTAHGSIENLPVKRISGQTTQFALKPGQESALRTVICGDGYAMPMLNENGQPSIVTGSSFHPRQSQAIVTASDHQQNLEKLTALSVDFEPLVADPGPLTGRASIRAAFADYLPAIGSRDEHTLFNVGYGSKGLVLAPLAGEIIADLIEGIKPPLEDDLLKRISPERFDDL